MLPTALHIQCVERQSKHTANALHGHSAAPSSQKTARLTCEKGPLLGVCTLTAVVLDFYLIETYVEKRKEIQI